MCFPATASRGLHVSPVIKSFLKADSGKEGEAAELPVRGSRDQTCDHNVFLRIYSMLSVYVPVSIVLEGTR